MKALAVCKLSAYCYHFLLIALKFNIWLNNLPYVQLNFNICLIRRCMLWKAFAQHTSWGTVNTDRMHHFNTFFEFMKLGMF